MHSKIAKEGPRYPGRDLPFGFRCSLRKILHVLPHLGDIPRRAPLLPGFIALCDALQVSEEVFVPELLASLRDDRFEALPNSEEFATGLKKQIVMEEAV